MSCLALNSSIKGQIEPDVVVHAYNPRSSEEVGKSEEGGSEGESLETQIHGKPDNTAPMGPLSSRRPNPSRRPDS
jgi:hypothetical protein